MSFEFDCYTDWSAFLPRTCGCVDLWVWVAGMVLLLATPLAFAADPERSGPSVADVAQRLEDARPHPRLFLDAQGLADLQPRIAADPTLTALRDRLLAEADGICTLPVVEAKLNGRRLLSVSRTVLRRTMVLGLAYRLTGQRKYLDRAEKTMLAMASLESWNPGHFLDVGEMTAGMAVGYDWFYEDLSETTRSAVRTAIVEKGLQASLDPERTWWVSVNSNWNQVCHAGVTIGALAVAEDNQDLAARIIARAVENVPLAMDAYGPSGAYTEGPMYWDYGTSFNVLLIEALRTALGTDFGLGEHRRFLESGEYYLHAHGPTGRFFNYSDCPKTSSISPTPFWFARECNRPDLLWMETPKLLDLLKHNPSPDGQSDRLLPLLLVWAPPLENLPAPKMLTYHDTGETPVAMLRSGWDAEAVFVGLKGGSPSAGHAHMDIGSFVLAAGGVRWAIDLGLQSYQSLESKNVWIWKFGQDSPRWTVFRLNNFSHNTLTVDGELQRAAGMGTMIDFSANRPTGSEATLDMSSVYEGQLASVQRSIRLAPDESVFVQDSLRGGENDVEVRWAMVTQAEIQLDGAAAVLRQDGRVMTVAIDGLDDVQFEIASTAPPAEYDAENPGTRMLVFRTKIPADADVNYSVRFTLSTASVPVREK